MKYKKGESGNKEGRPKGVKNKIGSDLRERIITYLSNEFQNVEEDLKKLPPRDRIKLYVLFIIVGNDIEMNSEMLTTKSKLRH